MNRLMALAVVAMMAATGCATGVEDPQPPPPTPTQGNPAPVQTFSDEIDTSVPDPTQIGNGGLDAPDVENLKFEAPVPVNGIDKHRESDAPSFDPAKFEAPVPVNE